MRTTPFKSCAGVKGHLEYLRVLHLAATHVEADVEAALDLLLREQRPITADAVKTLIAVDARIDVPAVDAPVVDLSGYDELLVAKAVAS